MERRRNELDSDEFEKLLGEIPKVASENNNLLPLCLSSCKASSAQKLQNNGSLDERGALRIKSGQSPMNEARSEEANLPDDRSFTSAFAEPSTNFGSQRQTILSSPENSHLLFIPSCESQNSVTCVFEKFDARKLNPQAFMSLQQFGYLQNHPSGVSFSPAHALQGVQFSPNMQLPAGFTVMPNQPQCLPRTQSLSRYLPLNQSHMSWRNIEEGQYQRLKMQEEQYLRMNPHFFYLRNRSMEAPSKLSGPKQRYSDTLGSVTDQFSGDLLCNEKGGVKGLDKVGKMDYPEKILIRSKLGMNTGKAVGYVLGDESHKNVKQNGRLRLHNQVEDLSLWDLYGTMNLKSNSFQKYNSLAEARGRIYSMAKDQHGCRFLQRKFSEKNGEDIDMVFCEIIDHIMELMTDPFGNYLVQKLLEVCNEDQRMQIIHSITRKPGELIRISCDTHGTRVVQKVIETVKVPDQASIVASSLKPGIITLIKNMNGNHVAQRCLQYLLPQCGKFLFEAAITHCVELATDRHGCCVLQKCLGHSEGEQRHRLVSEITSNALLLSQDPFGNYVLQFVFELQLQWAILEILEQLEGNYTDLSMQKCSSNVVEKCLKQADEEHQAHIIREVMNSGRLDQVMQDPYGNYVIQAALKQSKGSLHAVLVEAIRPYIPSLRTNPYGKKVLSALSLKK